MKNKKAFGLYGTNKRKTAGRRKEYAADEYTEEMYEEFGEDNDAYYEDDDIEEYEDDDEYIVGYNNGEEYYEEEYASEEPETDGYDAQEEYYTEEEMTEEEEYYAEDEPVEEEEYYAGEEPTEEEEYYAEEEPVEDEEIDTEKSVRETEYYAEDDTEGSEDYAEDDTEDSGYFAEDYAEDTESYYGEDDFYEEDENEYYESGEYGDEYDEYDDEYDEDSFDTAYGGVNSHYNASYDEGYDDSYDAEEEDVVFGTDFVGKVQFLLYHVKKRAADMTALDAVLVATGVALAVAVIVILSMFLGNKRVNEHVQAIAPIGTELAGIGIVGGDGLSSMTNAALLGNFSEEQESTTESTSENSVDGGKVSVSFTSVEKDLKIRFTDAASGELITGTRFEVKLVNTSSKKELVLADDDMDGIIYAENIRAGVFDAVITSTDKYQFPTVAQQVTVKDKVEYVVINVQDEVKSEKQVNVAAEDTQKQDAAAEEVKLTDTVEWVESTKTPIGGSESYLPIDKNTIPDPSGVSKAAARMLFDTINVTLDKSSLSLKVGATAALLGTAFNDRTEGDIEYKYTTEWKSSDESVATVSNGTVTAKAEGTATVTYTVTRKTITTTYEPEQPTEEIVQIDLDEYDKLSGAEKEKCTPIKDDADQTIAYDYRRTIEPEKKTSETTDTASASCEVKVEAAKLSAAKLELTASQESCGVDETIVVKPSRLVYTKDDGSTETVTENFPAVTWSSSDKSIAEAASDGTVTGKKAGSAVITGQMKGIKGADGKELDIKAQVNITITASAAGTLTIALDRTQGVYIAVGGTTTLVAAVDGYTSDAGVTWETSDKKVATVNEKGVVTGVSAGSAVITAVTKEKDGKGNPAKASCTVTVNSNASGDTVTKLKDANGNQIYLKNGDGSYKEAVFADYYTSAEFYIKTAAQYKYTGWQTIDGKTYYYDKNGNPVTGAQVIQGVTYNFGTDGAIATTVNGSKFGIDVSRHNGDINWNAVKASGVDYVIIRCGYRGSATGALIQDQSFTKNIQGATAAGLKVGIYVFSQAVNEVEAVKEASLAVACAKGYNLTYPIFIDTESSGGRADKIDKATRTAVVNAFCQTVVNSGYKAGIYASKTWFEDRLNMGAVSGSYRIWLAQYAAAPTYKGKYDMWQYSSKGKISGIKGNVDLNWSYMGY